MTTHRTVSCASVTLATLCALSGCATIVPTPGPSPETPLARDQVGLTQEMLEAVPLDPSAIVISAGTYEALLKQRGDPAPLPARHGAAVLAANLADPAALGVISTLHRRPTLVDSNLFIVLRDPAVTEHDKLEGRDAFVAAVELRGWVSWFGRSPYVALLSRVQCATCRTPPRGCRPIFGVRSRSALPFQFSSSRPEASGLPPTVLLNLESGSRPLNGSGRRPRLLVFSANRAEGPSEYECHAPVGWDESPREPRTADRQTTKPVRTFALPKDAILLGERDYLAALSQQGSRPADSHDVQATRQLLTLANSDEAFGISGRYKKGQTYSGDLFAVARDPVLTLDGRVTATEYYLAPVKLSGTATWLGTLAEITFDSQIPDVAGGFCGLVSASTDIPRCDRPPCGPVTVSLDGSITREAVALSRGAPAGYSVEPGEAGFGADRWPAGNRVTLHVPKFEAGRIGLPEFSTLACSDHRPPFEIVPNAAGAGGCGNGEVEVCNGVDDDCDGDIDEDSVCANRNTQCTRQPPTPQIFALPAASCTQPGSRF